MKADFARQLAAVEHKQAGAAASCDGAAPGRCFHAAGISVSLGAARLCRHPQRQRLLAIKPCSLPALARCLEL